MCFKICNDYRETMPKKFPSSLQKSACKVFNRLDDSNMTKSTIIVMDGEHARNIKSL